MSFLHSPNALALKSQLFSLAHKTKNPFIANKLHAQIIKSGLNHHHPFPKTLINVYAKCSLFQDALKLFDALPHRDHVAWATILSACNISNLPHKAFSISLPILQQGLQPDHFVFSSLIKACANLGSVHIKQGKQLHARFLLSPFYEDDVVKSSLVDMYAKFELPDYGRAVFDSISELSSVSWTAMISGYARNGRKVEALRLFRQSPFKNLYAWTALISGLVQSGNATDALYLFVEMRREGVSIADPLVLSSAVGACANAAVWELGKQDEILGLMRKLDAEMKKRGYVPDTSSVLHDMDQQEKERQLFWHSERLAVAYGLLKAVPGTIIRIVKNLRVCGDCHTVLKLTSTITNLTLKQGPYYEEC
ncbi:hypothetical protein TSUD_326570 [Trifolium subterraneum]|uniref:DYW domain-containing protein n=1 Tax=Trifolium subterraneum TaxID=3900 RepID=A0A2Z6PC14_TRISU|nr:hypothetical protein TSUD_326570 [Trifolium subterraneum]